MNKSEKIRLFYGIFLSVLTAVVGVVFIITVADIYYTGKEQGLEVIYTVGRITEHLTLPLVFLFVWIAAIIGGFVLSVVFPVTEKHKAYADDKKILAMLKSRMPTEGASEGFDEAKAKIKKLDLIRIIVWCVTSAALMVCSIFIMVYVFDPSHFSQSNFLEDMLTLVRNIIIFVGIGLIVSIVAVLVDGIMTKRQVAYIKQAIKTGDKNTVPKKTDAKKNLVVFATVTVSALTLLAVVLYIIAPSLINTLLNSGLESIQFIVIACLILAFIVAGVVTVTVIKKYVPEKADRIIVLCTRVAVGAVAIAFIIVGALNGGAGDVLAKAIAICTECIGLG